MCTRAGSQIFKGGSRTPGLDKVLKYLASSAVKVEGRSIARDLVDIPHKSHFLLNPELWSGGQVNCL